MRDLYAKSRRVAKKLLQDFRIELEHERGSYRPATEEDIQETIANVLTELGE
jgi:hypothetical protein